MDNVTVAAATARTADRAARLRSDGVTHMTERVDVVWALLHVADEAERVAEAQPQLGPLRRALDRLREAGLTHCTEA